MHTLKRFSFVSAILLAMLGAVAVVAAPADATTPPKSVTLNCANPEIFYDGVVYLFPSDVLEISFSACDRVDLHTENAAVTTEMTGTGFITLRGDGTFVVSADVTNGGPNQGEWLTSNASYAEIAFIDDDEGFIGFIDVEMVRENVTSIAGATLLDSPRFVFPVVLIPENLLETTDLPGTCIDNNAPGSPEHPFVSHTFSPNVAGVYTVRTISTTPITSLTNYIDTPDGFGLETPLKKNNFLLYSEFDPANPAQGFIECGSNGEGIRGNYLDSGEVLTKDYYELEVYLEPGTYTILSVRENPMSIATWNNTNDERWWTPLEGQSVNAQIWGPAQLPTPVTPELAATGGPNFAPLAAMVFTAGLALLWLRRRFMLN